MCGFQFTTKWHTRKNCHTRQSSPELDSLNTLYTSVAEGRSHWHTGVGAHHFISHVMGSNLLLRSAKEGVSRHVLRGGRRGPWPAGPNCHSVVAAVAQFHCHPAHAIVGPSLRSLSRASLFAFELVHFGCVHGALGRLPRRFHGTFCASRQQRRMRSTGVTIRLSKKVGSATDFVERKFSWPLVESCCFVFLARRALQSLARQSLSRLYCVMCSCNFVKREECHSHLLFSCVFC